MDDIYDSVIDNMTNYLFEYFSTLIDAQSRFFSYILMQHLSENSFINVHSKNITKKNLNNAIKQTVKHIKELSYSNVENEENIKNALQYSCFKVDEESFDEISNCYKDFDDVKDIVDDFIHEFNEKEIYFLFEGQE